MIAFDMSNLNSDLIIVVFIGVTQLNLNPFQTCIGVAEYEASQAP